MFKTAENGLAFLVALFVVALDSLCILTQDAERERPSIGGRIDNVLIKTEQKTNSRRNSFAPGITESEMEWCTLASVFGVNGFRISVREDVQNFFGSAKCTCVMQGLSKNTIRLLR